MFKKKIFTVVLAVIACTAVLGGCGSDNAGGKKSDTNDKNSTVSQTVDADAIWKEFLAEEKYTRYTADHSKEDLEYAITDLNSDDLTELLIQSTTDVPFFNTWLFALDGEEVKLVNETYGYGSFRYSSRHNCVIVSPEFSPFNGTYSMPFYDLEGTELKYNFTIGSDEGQLFYRDDEVKKDIDEDLKEAYTGNIKDLEWKPIDE